MSITPIVASLVAVLATLLGGWFVTTQVTDRWDQKKKNREMIQAAAHDFERFDGEVIGIWKTWNALSGSPRLLLPRLSTPNGAVSSAQLRPRERSKRYSQDWPPSTL